MKYIDSEKLISEINNRLMSANLEELGNFGCHRVWAYNDVKDIIASLQQEHPIEGKQVVIITETDGDANIHWDCRSLDDVKALLASAQSFIADKQVEELRGQGSGPDYNTTEGRFRNAHKFQQEQPEVDLEKEIKRFLSNATKMNKGEWRGKYPISDIGFRAIARHFYDLGLNAKKK